MCFIRNIFSLVLDQYYVIFNLYCPRGPILGINSLYCPTEPEVLRCGVGKNRVCFGNSCIYFGTQRAVASRAQKYSAHDVLGHLVEVHSITGGAAHLNGRLGQVIHVHPTNESKVVVELSKSQDVGRCAGHYGFYINKLRVMRYSTKCSVSIDENKVIVVFHVAR